MAGKIFHLDRQRKLVPRGMGEVNRADDLKLGKRPAQREHLRQIVQTLDVEASRARPPTPRCAEQRSPQCVN